MALPAIGIVLANLLVAYLISFFSSVAAVGWFCFAIGFQFGKWHGQEKKEEELITKDK